MVVDELYRDAADNEGARSSFTFDSSIIEKALHNIHAKRINTRTTIDAGLFSEVQRIVSNAIDIGYDAPAGDSGFAQELKNNAEVWSAFKVHRMGRDIAARMLDEDGNLKSFEQFKADTKDIVDHQVGRWLRTEFDTAVKRAHRAAEMRQFMEEADVFPNIEWLPSTAVNPRESHMPFYHRIWPIDDPFWEKHNPGDEWGCQCDWRATDEEPTDNTGIGEESIKPSAGLGGDPSRTGIIFSDNHPYFPNSCGNCVFNKGQLSLFTNKDKDCYQCTKAKKAIDRARRIAHEETKDELKAAFIEVREQIKREFGYDAIIPLPVGAKHGTGKMQLNADAVKMCLKSYKHTGSIRSKRCLLEASRHPERLRYLRWAELGEGKDLTNPDDVRNIERKRERGVIGYNRYEFEFDGDTWILGLEEVKDGYEQPYFIALK